MSIADKKGLAVHSRTKQQRGLSQDSLKNQRRRKGNSKFFKKFLNHLKAKVNEENALF
jgi:hypothetical protein